MSARSTAREGRILEDLQGVIEPLGLQIEDVAVVPAGKRRVVRVLVDRDLAFLAGDDLSSPVPALDLDQVADVTRAISDRMDAADHMGDQAYVLEVSSPGTDRPLTLPRHYRRNVGRLLRLVTTDGTNLTGRLIEAGLEPDTPLRLRVDEGKGKVSEHTLTIEDIAKAHVQIEFNRPETADGTGPGTHADEQEEGN